jgi:hypothetical protein
MPSSVPSMKTMVQVFLVSASYEGMLPGRTLGPHPSEDCQLWWRCDNDPTQISCFRDLDWGTAPAVALRIQHGIPKVLSTSCSQPMSTIKIRVQTCSWQTDVGFSTGLAELSNICAEVQDSSYSIFFSHPFTASLPLAPSFFPHSVFPQ